MTQCLAGSEPSETCTLLTVLQLQGVPPESCVEDYEAWSQPLSAFSMKVVSFCTELAF